jgi:aminoglycoside phosphotransferase (APT) family kinase protein
MSLMDKMLPRVNAYLDSRSWDEVPALKGANFQVAPLAQGEYNLNYLIRTDRTPLVFRVNVGTQIDRDDQILYEFKALKLLAGTGVTPKPYFVDGARDFFDRGILIMEYLPGEPLDYPRDFLDAASLLARIHREPVRAADNHLIAEDAPLTLIYTECRRLLQRYFDSELADAGIRSYLRELIDWADGARPSEAYYQSAPWPCVVNTEVNSGNFIVNRSAGSIHLVDWEMPRWGDPSQDLSHFCSPLTTLWKTRWRMQPEQKKAFLDAYRKGIEDRHLRDTLADRVRLRDPFVYLRGISWSAMGWVAYQTEFSGTRNPDTWSTLNRYMDLDFIRSLFDPFIGRG